MLIENDNRFHTPYLVVRLSVIDRYIQIRFNMYRKILEMKMIIIFILKTRMNKTGIRLVESRWKLV